MSEGYHGGGRRHLVSRNRSHPAYLTYRSWRYMLQRINSRHYPAYQGVRIAPEWTSLSHAESLAKAYAVNRRRIEWNGIVDSLSGWAVRTSISVSALSKRLRLGWPIERALSEPPRRWPSRVEVRA
jgi:hypothetical protein